jgi:SAM-dependent methyltransferase
MNGGHDDAIVGSFTAQAESFNASPAMNAGEALDTLVELAGAAGGTWLEVACGPGILARRLARTAGSVVGVDLTPAMLATAVREAARAGLANVAFVLADVYRLPLPDAGVDGAATRFSLHHLALPRLALAEVARVVRPGGVVVLADHVCAESRADAVWHQTLERLRDPSHWTSLTAVELRDLGRGAGLALEDERVAGFETDFGEWWDRGAAGPGARLLADALFSERPAGVAGCELLRRDGALGLRFTHSVTRWRRP